MLNTAFHGGQCCGIRHIYNFTEVRADRIESEVSRARSVMGHAGLYEIVLTGSQLRRRPTVAAVIQDLGFKLVTRFKNPNSRNTCYVFHWVKNPVSDNTALPFKVKKEGE